MNRYWKNRKGVEQTSLVLSIIFVVTTYSNSYYNKIPCRISSLSGEEYVESLIQQNYSQCIQEVFCMPLYTFLQLQAWSQENTGLKPTKHVGVPEKLAMFVETVGQRTSNRGVQESFQHSGNSVSQYFHEIRDALDQMHIHYVKLPDKMHQTDKQSMNNSKYASYFGDCLRALDGTHIEAYVPYKKRILYRNHKRTLSQNVLAVMTFYLQYCYILPGWERSAHDSRVLTDVVGNHGFKVPKNKYYLADAGYPNFDYVMIPYQGIRYHLKEQILAGQKPENAKELFNLRHTSL